MNEVFAPLTLSVPVQTLVARGECIVAVPAGALAPSPALSASSGLLPALPAGTRLGLAGGPCDLVVESVLRLPPAEAEGVSRTGLLLAALDTVDVPPGEHEFAASRQGLAVAVVVLSDKGSRGERVDKCAPIIQERLAGALPVCHARQWIIPDDPGTLKALLADLCLAQGYDLVLTSGGTGVAPRDTTPEATLAVIERRLPGYERAMTAASLAKTPHGAISRAVAGTLGRAVVVNLPGSPKAVAENLDPLLPTLVHTISKLQGDPSDCAQA
ncbi:MogA/MoaB family molybdenum cofactor biosynthesis protein [Desulfocurvus sp. DL9XJH121]